MKTQTFLILGGYGNVGIVLSELLLKETKLNLIIGGRNLEKAENVASDFNKKFEGERVSGFYVDATDSKNLREIFKKVDFVFVASSTAKYTELIAKTALETGCDYMDIHFGSQVYNTLKTLSKDIEKSERCFITGGGFHPGLPSAVIRYASQYFDSMDKAIVAGLMNVDFKNYEMSQSTEIEFLEEILDFQPFLYKNGAWQKINIMSTKDFITIDFKHEFGKKQCTPMFFEELREIPTIFPTIKETGFYIAGFNWFVDYVIFPFIFIALKLFPKNLLKPMSKLMVWGLKTFSKPPYGLVMKLEVSGKKSNNIKNLKIELSANDGAYFTAIPVVACLLQYLDGSINKSGLWLQANVVEPNRFFDDIKRMGVKIKIFEKN